jgi:hypothetical protein
MSKHTQIVFHVMAWNDKPYHQKPTKVRTFDTWEDAYTMVEQRRELNTEHGLSNWYHIEEEVVECQHALCQVTKVTL